MKYKMAIKLCFAIEQMEDFNSDQSYSIEKDPARHDNEEAWIVKITFKESTNYWVIENLVKAVKLISPNIHMEVIWEKRQLLLNVIYYEEKVTESLDSQLKGLQLDEQSEKKEKEES
jgi:hypothetical protein